MGEGSAGVPAQVCPRLTEVSTGCGQAQRGDAPVCSQGGLPGGGGWLVVGRCLLGQQQAHVTALIFTTALVHPPAQAFHRPGFLNAEQRAPPGASSAAEGPSAAPQNTLQALSAPGMGPGRTCSPKRGVRKSHQLRTREHSLPNLLEGRPLIITGNQGAAPGAASSPGRQQPGRSAQGSRPPHAQSEATLSLTSASSILRRRSGHALPPAEAGRVEQTRPPCPGARTEGWGWGTEVGTPHAESPPH